MAHVLLLHSSIYGLSRRICERLAVLLTQQGLQTRVAPLQGYAPDDRPVDLVVIGASIRQGKHNPAVLEFIQQHQPWLESRPNAFFSVNLVARKPTKNTPETNPYLQRFLANCPWKPQLLGVFAGELDYARYGAFDRHAVRFIMWLNKGPTDLKTRVEFTNWAEVQRFGERLAGMVQPAQATARAVPPMPDQRQAA